MQQFPQILKKIKIRKQTKGYEKKVYTMTPWDDYTGKAQFLMWDTEQHRGVGIGFRFILK